MNSPSNPRLTQAVHALRAGLVFSVSLGSVASASVVVFSDGFTRANVNTVTTSGSTALGNGWTMHSDASSPVRGGARIENNVLQIGNTTTTGSYAGGGGADRTWVWQDTNNWSSPYSSTLTNNPGLVSWSFNMRTGQVNPTGVSTSGGTTVVTVLATSQPGSGDWQFGGSGYYVSYNSSANVDPLRLVRMESGVRNESLHTSVITAGSAPFNDLGNQYLSITVTFDPETDLWSLFARADSGGVFQDPLTGTLTSLGSAVDSTYTGTELRYMGFFGNSNNGTNGATDDLRFDNLTVSVVPEPSAPALLGLSSLALLRRRRRH